MTKYSRDESLLQSPDDNLQLWQKLSESGLFSSKPKPPNKLEQDRILENVQLEIFFNQ